MNNIFVDISYNQAENLKIYIKGLFLLSKIK